MSGLITRCAFPTYPDGFPPRVIEPFERAIGRSVLGNKPASGTEIIKELGGEHVRTGRPIVYTSADSVFQIAAHEEVVPLAELYRWSELARELLTGEDQVGRVIARPFIGEPGAFKRTEARRDYAIEPPEVLSASDPMPLVMVHYELASATRHMIRECFDDAQRTHGIDVENLSP